MRPAIMFNMVVIGTALAALAQAMSLVLTLAPPDPMFGQPEPLAPQTTNNSQTANWTFVKTKILETNDSWSVIAGNAEALPPNR